MKKLVEQVKKIWAWIISQFKNHPVRSAAVVLPAAALITAGVLFLCGVFSPAFNWNYLPNRAYILAPLEREEPQNLYELLHSDAPDAETFLRNPAIAQELMDAGEWTDVVDSRYALYNLRELDRQINERLDEAALSFAAAGFIPPEEGLLAGTPLAEPGEMSAARLAALSEAPNISPLENAQSQFFMLETLKMSSGKLLTPGLITDEDLIALDAAVNLKGLWQNPGEALIHMTPEGGWLPDEGYTLTRSVGGQETVIAEKAAAPGNGLQGNIGGVNADLVRELYSQARLTPEKLAALGMSSAEEFRKTAYRADSLEPKKMISGANDFDKMSKLQITTAGELSQKIPESDRLLASPILVMSQQPNGMFLQSSINSALNTKFSFVPSKQVTGIDVFKKYGGLQYDTAEEILAARQQISTLSFVDSGFAEEADFLIRDDLSGLNLPDGTEITYTVKSEGAESAISLIYGKETTLSKPGGLAGYGYDGVVSLRWDDLSLDETADPAERGIISGYHIERKLEGEADFTRITEEPIVIGYMLDELGWMQSPIFFQDEAENGVTAEYRVSSMDIFGRASEVSEAISVKVEKITPPDAPSAGTPVLSSENAGGGPVAVQSSIEQNAGMKGVVLPIYAASPDTARFTIYRAAAVGAGNFGEPRVLADIMYDGPAGEDSEEDSGGAAPAANPAYSASALPVYSYSDSSLSNKTLKNIKQFMLTAPAPAEPSFVYFDADVEEGCYYKYWVSAWDEERWNNESAWSRSVTAAVPTDREPESPSALNISMLARALPDRSQDSPGLVNDMAVTKDELDAAANAGASLKIPEPAGDALAYTGAVNADIIKTADDLGIEIGGFSKSAVQPVLMGAAFNNLPEQKYILSFAAVPSAAVRADGTATLKWPAYSGDGLKGYNIYQAMFAPLPLEDMQKMTRAELLQLGFWQKVNETPIAANQLIVSGLGGAWETTLYLVCLVPEKAQSQIIEDLIGDWRNESAPSAPVPPEEPTDLVEPTLLSIRNAPELNTPEFFRRGFCVNSEAHAALVSVGGLGIAGFYYDYPENIEKPLEVLKYLLANVSSYNYAHNCDASFEYEAVYVLTAYIEVYGAALAEYEEAVAAYEKALADYERAVTAYEEAVYVYLTSGYVSVEWDVPDDPQVKAYRVYRAEVLSFKKPVNEDLLEWTLVGDNLAAPAYTDPVSQGHALFYYYRVTSVSPWGVETDLGTLQRFRVPSTMPPATPNLLVPLQRKDGVQVNFSSVQYCDRYIVYRAEIPKISDAYLAGLNFEFKNALFGGVTENDKFLSSTLKDSINLSSSANPQGGMLNAASRFNTMSYAGKGMLEAVNSVSADTKLSVFNSLMKDFGPLALTNYSDLSVEMMKRVKWEEVGTLEADYDTVEEELDPDTGLPGMLKPLNIIDETAEYGKTYLYTVQAWNDDNLGSTRPEPVEASPRRSGPFNPITGLKGEIVNSRPSLSWDTPAMKNLDKQRCLDETVGYIVYRSDTEDGEYFQASPLVFEPEWVDEYADPFAYNWYRVKVLDTGGYLSEFAEPVLVQINFAPIIIKPFMPLITGDTEKNPPVVEILGGPHTAVQGEKLIVQFAVTGDEPISYTIEGAARGGAAISGMVVDGEAKTIIVPGTLPAGSYGATLTAENEAGSGRASFNFTVEAAAAAPKISFNNSKFSVQQGSAFQTAYTLTGTEPITVTVSAVNSRGGAVSGFTVNASAKTVSAPANLAAGSYTVTAVAKNGAGEGSASFTLEVAAAAVPPVISFAERKYTATQGKPLQAEYGLTGTEPITVTVSAVNSRGGAVSGFVVNAASRAVSAPENLAAGSYTVTAVAKNGAGESSASFTLEVSASVVPPVISFAERKYTATQGKPFQTDYSLTGTEPITVTVSAVNSRGGAVSGFAVNAVDKTVSAPASLAAGSYTVTAQAKNGAGESSASFTLEVAASAEPPVIAFRDTKFTVPSSNDFQSPYTLTGTEPITITVDARNSSGAVVSGFIADTSARTVNAPIRLPYDTYTVTAFAENSAGKSSAAFTLTVEPPAQIAPKITTTMYENRMTQGRDYSMQFSATGSEPLVWSLEQSGRLPVPAEASIDGSGRLNIKGSIVVSTYEFVVKVSNGAGSDALTVVITVQAGLAPLPLEPVRPRATSYDAGRAPNITLLTSLQAQPAVPAVPGLVSEHYDSVRIEGFEIVPGGDGGYWLDDVNVSTPPFTVTGTPPVYAGTATLRTGGNEGIPVSISGARLNVRPGGAAVMTAGSLYIPEAVELPKLGLTISSLEISVEAKKSAVSGYVLSTTEGQNLMGNMYALEFTDAQLKNGYIITRTSLLHLKYQQFVIRPKMQLSGPSGAEIWINLNAERTNADDFIALNNCAVTMKSHLETLNNEGFTFDSVSNLYFNLKGEMSAALSVNKTQSFQLLVPGGAMLRVETAFLRLVNGAAASEAGYLTGRLILPFERDNISGGGSTAAYAGHHPDTNEMDELFELYKEAADKDKDGNITDADAQKIINSYAGMSLDEKIYYFGQIVQQNSLLIVPDDPELQEQLAYVNIDARGWGGRGFIVEKAEMTPARVTNRNLGVETQRSQATVVEPTFVSVDLDRGGFVNPFADWNKQEPNEYETKETMLPKETQEDFWVGLIMHGGTVALPPDFVKSKEDKTIKFSLAPGEMIYDLNGFNYQTYVYGPEEGVPAHFGEALGGFEDVLVKNVLLDMYANRVNLEINADVMLEMLGNTWVKAKLYTNKEDNADGRAGEFLCSAAPTTLENVFGADVSMEVYGGFFRPDGLHMNGGMVMNTGEVQTGRDPLAFTNMIIPPKSIMTNTANDPGRKFCGVLLDKPTDVRFQGFSVEIRRFDLEYMSAEKPLLTLHAPTRLTLEGSTLLSENIPLGHETTDRIVMESSALLLFGFERPQAQVLYGESPSLLEANLDDSVQITGMLVPKMIDALNEDGLMEFEAEKLSFGMLDALKGAGVDTTIRFGYDMRNKRCYYAVGVTSVKGGGDDSVVDIGIAKINNFAGLFFHNMEPPKDIKAPEDFSASMRTSAGLKEYIAGIPVYRGGGSTFGMGIICDFVIGDAVMLKDTYLYISSGPIISASGELWAKTNFKDYKLVCGAALCYSHPERYLRLSATIKDIPVLIFEVSGSIGFEIGTRPPVFGVYIGYPETLKLGKILGLAEIGVGFCFRIADGPSFVAMKYEAGLDVDIDLYIIYARGYLKFGAEGMYEFRPGASDYFMIQLWIKGGISGGIHAFGKDWNIISLYAEAVGTLEGTLPTDELSMPTSGSGALSDAKSFISNITLTASADIKIGFHLNVLLGSIGGSRTFHFTHTF